MRLIKTIFTGGFILLYTIGSYAQESTSLPIINSDIKFDFELQNGLNNLLNGAYNSVFKLSDTSPNYIGFQDVNIAPNFVNGDTIIYVNTVVDTLKIVGGYYDKKPTNIWRVYNSSNVLV